MYIYTYRYIVLYNILKLHELTRRIYDTLIRDGQTLRRHESLRRGGSKQRQNSEVPCSSAALRSAPQLHLV